VLQHIAVFVVSQLGPENGETGGSRELPSAMFWPSASFPFAKIDFQKSGRGAHAPRFRPFTCHASLPFIRISRFIGPVSGINDFVRWTPQFDESVGQKRFAIDPDTGLVSVKDY
jgi:hypothetical protein